MPEHVHLLVCPRRREYSTAAFCASVKVSVARRAVAWVRAHAPDLLDRLRDAQPNGKVAHRFWQRGGGRDRNLFTPATARAQIDYVHLNPVRRGLCGVPTDRAWPSARDHAAADRGGRRAAGGGRRADGPRRGAAGPRRATLWHGGPRRAPGRPGAVVSPAVGG